MYTIKQAAHRTGVSIPVLRAWQRRYGIVSPQRTAAGYRLYSDDDIARLSGMRRLVADGWSASAAAAFVAAQPGDAVAAADASTADPAALVERFTVAAAAMDGAALEAVLDAMGSAGSFEQVAERYLMPGLVGIGDAWARGTLDVAAEHAASHAVLRRLSAAFEAAGRAMPDARPVLVGLPPGAHHEFGALAFAVALRRAGVPVTYLGADLPTADWLEAVTRTNARAAVIAVPTYADRAAADEVAAALRAMSRELIVATGGAHAEGGGIGLGVVTLPNGLATAASELARAVRTG